MGRDSLMVKVKVDMIDRGKSIAKATEAQVSTAFKDLGQWG